MPPAGHLKHCLKNPRTNSRLRCSAVVPARWIVVRLDRPTRLSPVLPVTQASQRKNAGHVEVKGLAAGIIESGARNIFVGPLREPEVLVLRQLDFEQPVQLTRNQEVSATIRIPNPRDVIWRGKLEANRSGPLRLRLSRTKLELLPGQEINLPVNVEWPGSFVKHGRHPVSLEIQEPTGGTITATLEVEVAFPGLNVELISDSRMIMVASQPLDTQITWWDRRPNQTGRTSTPPTGQRRGKSYS